MTTDREPTIWEDIKALLVDSWHDFWTSDNDENSLAWGLGIAVVTVFIVIPACMAIAQVPYP